MATDAMTGRFTAHIKCMFISDSTRPSFPFSVIVGIVSTLIKRERTFSCAVTIG